MKKISTAVSALLITLLLPAITFAQFTSGGAGGNFSTFFGNIRVFISTILVPLVLALAFLFFLWGVFKFFIAGGADEEKRNEGKQLMIYSIIGFVLIVALYGIVNFVVGGLGFDADSADIVIPTAPTVAPYDSSIR